MTSQFAKDVLAGLTATPKRLQSKYFYDEKGDVLFQKIMDLDEYYLTRSEYEVLERNKSEILSVFAPKDEPFHLLEFGAGDGLKTKILLKHFLAERAQFDYLPIDISKNAIDQLVSGLHKDFPNLQVKGIANEYFQALQRASLMDGHWRKVVLFLGSNIGNFSPEQAKEFLYNLGEGLSPGDLLFIGFDLRKDPDVILAAYDDQEGVTRDFNLNLLERINRELDGNFELDKFKHFAVYNPETGVTASYLLSKEKQVVEIMDTAIQFDAWETIHTEISQKYDLKSIESLAREAGFKVVDNFFDQQRYFVDSVWQLS